MSIEGSRPVARTGLDEALAEHLSALERKDLDAYAATLADEVVLILPDGTVLDGKAAVVAVIGLLPSRDSCRTDGPRHRLIPIRHVAYPTPRPAAGDHRTAPSASIGRP
jgi:hypothetical protein